MKLHEYLINFIGIKYKWGGDDPISGFDCSGLVSEGLRALGLIKFDERMNCIQLLLFFKARGKTLHKDAFVTPGALLFFGSTNPNHVGVAISSTLMIECGGGNETTVTEACNIAQNSFVRIRPIAYRKNYIGYLNPI